MNTGFYVTWFFPDDAPTVAVTQHTDSAKFALDFYTELRRYFENVDIQLYNGRGTPVTMVYHYTEKLDVDNIIKHIHLNI